VYNDPRDAKFPEESWVLVRPHRLKK